MGSNGLMSARHLTPLSSPPDTHSLPRAYHWYRTELGHEAVKLPLTDVHDVAEMEPAASALVHTAQQVDAALGLCVRCQRTAGQARPCAAERHYPK